MPRALTVDQAAEFLQLSPYTIRQWLRTGKLPGRKIGRVYRILETDLAALVGTEAAPTAGAVRETAPEYPQVKGRRHGKPRKLVGRGSLAHVGELSSEAYLKLKQEEREREDQLLGTATRAERIDAVKGMLAGSKRTVEDFLREKHEDTERENRPR